jgi:hypothetical protein
MKRRPLFLALMALLGAFGLGLVLRPPLDSLLVRPDLSNHESRANLRDWKDGPLQVLRTQWKLTGEVDRTSGRDELVWLWRMVFLNATFVGECGVQVTRFALKDLQGFAVASGEPQAQEILVRPGAFTGETASVSGSGRLARARMSPKLQPDWELQTNCAGLPRFGEAKITEILETAPEAHPNLFLQRFFLRRPNEDVDSRRLGPVAKVRALHLSEASYIRENRDRGELHKKCGSDRRCWDRESERGRALRELAEKCGSDEKCWQHGGAWPLTLSDIYRRTGFKPDAIQIQFPRGANVRVGDVIYAFPQRLVQDEAGERHVGYGFTTDGSSLPLRYWSDTRAGG